MLSAATDQLEWPLTFCTHSFSAPELTTIAPNTDFSSAMIWFEPFEPGLSVDLPKLAFVAGSVDFVGVVNKYVVTNYTIENAACPSVWHYTNVLASVYPCLCCGT